MYVILCGMSYSLHASMENGRVCVEEAQTGSMIYYRSASRLILYLIVKARGIRRRYCQVRPYEVLSLFLETRIVARLSRDPPAKR